MLANERERGCDLLTAAPQRQDPGCVDSQAADFWQATGGKIIASAGDENEHFPFLTRRAQ